MSTELMSDQLAPSNVASEEAVLGAVVVNPDCLYELQFLQAEDFFIVRHGWIWEAMQAVRNRNEAIDYLMICNELRRQGRLEEVGGSSYIIGLTERTPSSLNAVGYARDVEEKALRRKVIEAARVANNLAYSDKTPIDEVLNGAERAVLGVVATRKRTTRVTAEEADARIGVDGDSSKRTLFTRLEELDRMTDCQIKMGRTLHILAASGHMKTTLASQLSADWALDGYPVLYVSMENPVEDIKDQMNKYIAFTRRLTYEDARVMLNRCKNLQLMSDRQSARDIEGQVMSMTYGGQEPGIVVVDTIQKLTDCSKQDQSAIAAGSAALDGARLRTGCLWVVLCQQYLKTNSRDVADLRPSRANVKDAKAIYQDARLMIGGYYADDWRHDFGDSWDDPLCGENEYLMKCLKNTFGAKQKVKSEKLAVVANIPALVSPSLVSKPVQRTFVDHNQPNGGGM